MNQESQVQTSLFHTYFEGRLREMKAYFADLVREYEAVVSGRIRDPQEVRTIAREYAAIAANREASDLFPYDVGPRATRLYALAESLEQQESAESIYQTGDDIRRAEKPRHDETHTGSDMMRTDEIKGKTWSADTDSHEFNELVTTSDNVRSFSLPESEYRNRTSRTEALDIGENSYTTWEILLTWAEEAEKLDLLVGSSGVTETGEDQFAEQ
jgi:hypothetical protein